MTRSPRTIAVVALSYVAVLAAIVVALVAARRSVMAQYGPEAIAQWQQWKRQTEHPDPSAPVARRAVTSDEPPLLILARDHFAAITVTCVAIGTVLFGFLALALRGAWRGNGQGVAQKEPR
ncbi:MAG TPA: hypothetical protein VHZ24_03035 [Pirellulales bacterium]|jgi:hypothetical protein|nr:hypothetical protein [Pirellulales bacterium]